MEHLIIHQKINEIRGLKVILDKDLALLYGVETKRLNEAVKRNLNRFPPDFMFRLTKEELTTLRSHIATSKLSSGGNRYAPYAFTEQGIAMLSGLLNSEIAIEINISIMRAFVSLRKLAISHDELQEKLTELEEKVDKQFNDVFDALNYLIQNAYAEACAIAKAKAACDQRRSKEKRIQEQDERVKIGFK